MRIMRSGPFDPSSRGAPAGRSPDPWRAIKPLTAVAALALGATSWGADISEIYAEAWLVLGSRTRSQERV
ncbi:MAG: hypothetical protein J4F38_11580 [Pseudomonadales bacterium]|nr:hypothetical protein [Pseudomonadales bacterium]